MVDDGRTLAGSPGALGRADVRRHLLDTFRGVRRAAARHRPHPQSTGRELPDDCRAGATRGPQTT